MHYICSHNQSLTRLAYFQYGYNAEVFLPQLQQLNRGVEFINSDVVRAGQAVYLPHRNNTSRSLAADLVQNTINHQCDTLTRFLIRDLCQVHLHPYIFSDILHMPLTNSVVTQFYLNEYAGPRKSYAYALQEMNAIIATYAMHAANLSEHDKVQFAAQHLKPAYDHLQNAFDKALFTLDDHQIERLRYGPIDELGFHTDRRFFSGLPRILRKVRKILPEIYALELNIDTLGNQQNLPWRDEVEIFLAEYASHYLSDIRLTPVMVLTRTGWVAQVIGRRQPFAIRHVREPFFVEMIKHYGRLGRDLLYGNARARAGAISEIIIEVLLYYMGGFVIKGATKLAAPVLSKLTNTATNLITKPKFAKIEKLGSQKEKQIASITRLSSNTVNEIFINEEAVAAGWLPPYPENLYLRKIVTAKELKFYRVHTDPAGFAGRFIAREDEIMQFLNNPESLRIHLALPQVPKYITEVTVPAHTELYVGRIGPQPNFGASTNSGFQYQIVKNLHPKYFTNTQKLFNQH